jgi:hypothetical protein
VSVPTLKRFECHLCTIDTKRFDVDGLRLEQICLHGVFLSIPSAHYADKADGSIGEVNFTTTNLESGQPSPQTGGKGRPEISENAYRE